jgi:RHH-type proline utilization regulon transcriptional repressor/proline dehydrogenase/delta 1-pyrroline-5-carboxylate dehydrogenase
MEQARVISQCSLSGPTGESNRYSWHPRQTVLGLASNDADRLQQLAATLAVGSRAIWEASAASLRESLPPAVQERIALADHWNGDGVAFDAVLCHADTADSLATCAALARRAGPIINLLALPVGSGDIALERLLVERSHSINTAAAGGNASLMTMG